MSLGYCPAKTDVRCEAIGQLDLCATSTGLQMYSEASE